MVALSPTTPPHMRVRIRGFCGLRHAIEESRKPQRAEVSYRKRDRQGPDFSTSARDRAECALFVRRGRVRPRVGGVARTVACRAFIASRSQIAIVVESIDPGPPTLRVSGRSQSNPFSPLVGGEFFAHLLIADPSRPSRQHPNLLGAAPQGLRRDPPLFSRGSPCGICASRSPGRSESARERGRGISRLYFPDGFERADLARGIGTPQRNACSALWESVKGLFRVRRVQSVPAVCIPPGARLVLRDIPLAMQPSAGVRSVENVVFTQIDVIENRHRDAMRFANGSAILLQRLANGQRVTVVSLGPDVANDLSHDNYPCEAWV